MKGGLTIGELARRGGVSLEAVRFYERAGILPKPPRTPSGYRLFPTKSVGRIRFVKKAQRLGFSLDEVKELLALRADPPTPKTCDDVRQQAEAKVEDVEGKPYRPLFIVVTVGFLGFAFYLAYRKPRSCSADGQCATPTSTRTSRAVLWIVTPLILGLLVFPYLTPYLFGQTGKGGMEKANPMTGSSQSGTATKQVVLKVDGMTCAACTVTVNRSLTAVDGVRVAKVTVDPPQAVIVYDPAKVSPDALTQATAKAGYPSMVKGGQP